MRNGRHNTMKTLIVAVGLLLLPVAAFAAYDDVSIDTSVTLTANSVLLSIFGSSAVVESLSLDSGSFTVVLPVNSHITVRSATGKKITHNGAATLVTLDECAVDGSRLGFSVSSGSSATITVTPSSDACTVGSTASGSGGGGSSSGRGCMVSPGGGGGGGGGSYTPPPPPPPPPTPLAAPAAPSGPTLTLFLFGLNAGSEGDDVTRLQTCLASDTSVYPQGLITGYFGSLTRAAVERFQEKYGIASAGVAGYGTVGPKTRAKLNELLVAGSCSGSAAPAAVEPSVPAPAAQPGAGSFTKPLFLGVSDPEVKLLQIFLNGNLDEPVAASSSGSSGNETEYFGSLTRAAVERFQEKYGIASAGVAGYGTVGPKTRAKLNELAGGQ